MDGSAASTEGGVCIAMSMMVYGVCVIVIVLRKEVDEGKEARLNIVILLCVLYFFYQIFVRQGVLRINTPHIYDIGNNGVVFTSTPIFPRTYNSLCLYAERGLPNNYICTQDITEFLL